MGKGNERGGRDGKTGGKIRRKDLRGVRMIAKHPRASVGLGSCPELTEKPNACGFAFFFLIKSFL